MKLFSQRIGLKSIKNVIQTDSIDNDLRNCLWNALGLFYLNQIKDVPDINYRPTIKDLLTKMWLNYFKEPLDTLAGYGPKTYQITRKYFFNCKWYEVYDFIEYIASNHSEKSVNNKFMNYCNDILKQELSAYRFINGIITKITSEEEISEIDEALKVTEPLKPIHSHLKTALKYLSDKKSPDYRNSIKESISAVEGICNLINGVNATLGKTLNLIESKVGMHGAMKSAFKSLYGYTSDSDGIRHALMDESKLDFEDAKFMLVSCSAFVNYLVAKASKAGIKI